MDFEIERRKKVVTVIEALVIICFLTFTIYQIYVYVSARQAAAKAEQEAWEDMLSHPVIDSVSDGKAELLPASYEYEGDHPYSSADLPYTLTNLSIESDEGTAVFTNGKDAGINLPVKGIPGSGTDSYSAVDLTALSPSPLTLSGTGSIPTLNIRYQEGYSVKVVLNHAIQASFNKDGDVGVYNLQDGDKFEIAYTFNYESYKYPGSTRFVLTGKASEDGALTLKLRGSILTISGLRFDDAMLSADSGSQDTSYGTPLDGGNAFVTYDFSSKTADTTTPKGGR